MALVKLRARLRTEGSRQITNADRRTNEQAIAVARGQAELPPFIAKGKTRWQEIRHAYRQAAVALDATGQSEDRTRSEEHTSELQSLMRISYAVFCLKKKKKNK